MEPRKVGMDNFNENVLDSSVPCIVKFSSEGCHFCQSLKPAYARLAREYEHKFKFFIVDINENPQLSAMFAESGVPTFYIFDDDGGQEIPDPKQPDPSTWFTEDYLKKRIKKYLKKKSEV